MRYNYARRKSAISITGSVFIDCIVQQTAQRGRGRSRKRVRRNMMVSEIDNVQTGLATEDYKYGFSMPENYVFKSRKGLDESVVREISAMKGEPDWMTRFRLRSLKLFQEKPMPQWGGNLNNIDFNDIFYYVKASDRNSNSWDDVPSEGKNTFDRLGTPGAGKKI